MADVGGAPAPPAPANDNKPSGSPHRQQSPSTAFTFKAAVTPLFAGFRPSTIRSPAVMSIPNSVQATGPQFNGSSLFPAVSVARRSPLPFQPTVGQPTMILGSSGPFAPVIRSPMTAPVVRTPLPILRAHSHPLAPLNSPPARPTVLPGSGPSSTPAPAADTSAVRSNETALGKTEQAPGNNSLPEIEESSVSTPVNPPSTSNPAAAEIPASVSSQILGAVPGSWETHEEPTGLANWPLNGMENAEEVQSLGSRESTDDDEEEEEDSEGSEDLGQPGMGSGDPPSMNAGLMLMKGEDEYDKSGRKIYRCRKCGVPKKGHSCGLDDGEDSPEPPGFLGQVDEAGEDPSAANPAIPDGDFDAERGMTEVSRRVRQPSSARAAASADYFPASKSRDVPQNAKYLLVSGVLEGVTLSYRDRNNQAVITGIVYEGSILCKCKNCKGNVSVSASEFERHAGSTARHPSDNIFISNGLCLKDLINVGMECKDHRTAIAAITRAIQSSGDIDSLRDLCSKCNEGGELILCSNDDCSDMYHASCAGLRGIPRGEWFCPNCRVETTPERPVIRARNNPSSSSKVYKRDPGYAHKALFLAGGLEDGTKLGYYSKGQKILGGIKSGIGILCDCCDKVLSCSSFEHHAGYGSRRNPYNCIFLENGQSLHEASAALLSNSRIISNGGHDESADTCGECGDGGELVLCDDCPGAYHLECVGLTTVPHGNYFCKLCLEKRESAMKVPGRTRGVVSVSSRNNSAGEKDFSGPGCVICRSGAHDFEKSSFGPRTIMICDQCEREFHVGCLKDKNIADLQSLPESEWFCSPDCQNMYQKVETVLQAGLLPVPEVLGPFKNGSGDYRWQILKGRKGNQENGRVLAHVMNLFSESFDPIIEERTKENLIPLMVHSRNTRDHDFSGMLSIVLHYKGLPISAATLRIFGHQCAELPLVATYETERRQGHCKVLMAIVEWLLSTCRVERLYLPAAKSAETTWIEGFGFTPMAREVFEYLRFELQMLVFPGATALEKVIPPRATKEDPFWSLQALKASENQFLQRRNHQIVSDTHIKVPFFFSQPPEAAPAVAEPRVDQMVPIVTVEESVAAEKVEAAVVLPAKKRAMAAAVASAAAEKQKSEAGKILEPQKVSERLQNRKKKEKETSLVTGKEDSEPKKGSERRKAKKDSAEKREKAAEPKASSAKKEAEVSAAAEPERPAEKAAGKPGRKKKGKRGAAEEGAKRAGRKKKFILDRVGLVIRKKSRTGNRIPRIIEGTSWLTWITDIQAGVEAVPALVTVAKQERKRRGRRGKKVRFDLRASKAEKGEGKTGSAGEVQTKISKFMVRVSERRTRAAKKDEAPEETKAVEEVVKGRRGRRSKRSMEAIIPRENEAELESVDKEVADKGMADKEMADNELADKEVADKEMAEKEAAEEEMAEMEMADKAMADKAMADKEMADKDVTDKDVTEMEMAEMESVEKEMAEMESVEKEMADKKEVPEKRRGRRRKREVVEEEVVAAVVEVKRGRPSKRRSAEEAVEAAEKPAKKKRGPKPRAVAGTKRAAVEVEEEEPPVRRVSARSTKFSKSFQ